MERVYISKYGKIVKRCPGLPEYWYHGDMIARGASLSSPNPDCPPTSDDWAFCVSLRADQPEEEKS